MGTNAGPAALGFVDVLGFEVEFLAVNPWRNARGVRTGADKLQPIGVRQ
jgi:hypothetical protein